MKVDMTQNALKHDAIVTTMWLLRLATTLTTTVLCTTYKIHNGIHGVIEEMKN